MPHITAIRVQEHRKNRCSLFVDQEFFSGVDAEVVVKLGLQVGQEISTETLRSVIKKEETIRAREKCLRLLERRARTRQELAQALRQDGIDLDIAADVLQRLEELQLVNDAEFARMFVRERLQLKGQGRWRLQAELRKRGIQAETIAQVLDELLPQDENAACEALALRKLKVYQALPLPIARRRMTAFLVRQGFHMECVQRVVRQVLPNSQDRDD